jgi:hypothetical protein
VIVHTDSKDVIIHIEDVIIHSEDMIIHIYAHAHMHARTRH